MQSVSARGRPQKPGNEAVVMQSVSARGRPQKPGNEAVVMQSVSARGRPQKPGNEAVVMQSVSACGRPQKPGNEAVVMQSKLQDKSWFKARAEWLIQESVIHACVVYVPSPCTDHVEDVVTAVFQYLAMIRREGPKEWIFKECAVRDRNGDLERGRVRVGRRTTLAHNQHHGYKSSQAFMRLSLAV